MINRQVVNNARMSEGVLHGTDGRFRWRSDDNGAGWIKERIATKENNGENAQFS